MSFMSLVPLLILAPCLIPAQKFVLQPFCSVYLSLEPGPPLPIPCFLICSAALDFALALSLAPLYNPWLANCSTALAAALTSNLSPLLLPLALFISLGICSADVGQNLRKFMSTLLSSAWLASRQKEPPQRIAVKSQWKYSESNAIRFRSQ